MQRGGLEEVPRPSLVVREGVRRTLITEEPWERYHLDALLPLKESHRENREFGFLLRHYWMPATTLTFRHSSRRTFPDGQVDSGELEIHRKMARCRSNECLWRETICRLSPAKGVRATPDASAVLSETLCSYNCYEQTYTSAKPLHFQLPTAEEKTEARRAALAALPLLVPAGPVPLGFRWYAKVGEDYLNFQLESEEHLGETSVLVIRREGHLTLRLPREPETEVEGPVESPLVRLHRQGLTLFAWNRGAVLEDRCLDRIVAAERDTAEPLGTIHQTVCRLVRSCPEEAPATTAVPAPSERKPEGFAEQ